MKFSPPHKDNVMRATYGFLVVCGLVLFNIGEGLLKTVFMSLSLVFLATGLFLFIRFEMTSFTYIVMENEKRLDFYVDRAVGKRGTYVCYFPLYDCVEFLDFTKEAKEELKKKYPRIVFFNYCHNKVGVKKQIMVFEADGTFEAVIIQLDEYRNYMLNAIELSKKETD